MFSVDYLNKEIALEASPVSAEDFMTRLRPFFYDYSEVPLDMWTNNDDVFMSEHENWTVINRQLIPDVVWVNWKKGTTDE